MSATGSKTTLIELYRTHKQAGIEGENSRALLSQAHWFFVNATFDPKTAEALPQRLTSFMLRVAQSNDSARRYDRLWRITHHARASVERLARVLNENPRRGHALLPVRAVRELDANSFIKLSNRPGRTIREKLAGKPYLQAVRRYQSVDLPENRLFKVFVSRLAELLLLRQNLLSEEEDSLLPTIQSWLRTDEAFAISRWDNPPPNNALLSHRDYRRVWDAWRWLQTLDEDISHDLLHLEQRRETVRRWTEYARMYQEGSHRFAEMPVLFDYEQFEIRPWCQELISQRVKPALRRSIVKEEICGPVCIDLTLAQPLYASSKQPANDLEHTFVWQRWQNDSECVDIELFASDAVYLHAEAVSIAFRDLFFLKVAGADHLDLAARAFSAKLRDIFKHDTLLWLVPDFLSDFDVEVIRRNLNACYPNAEPLPRSIAAAFEQVDYSKITHDGFSIAIVDCIGGKTCVTKLVARHDTELGKLVPETRGFYWERCPPVVIDDRNPANDDLQRYGPIIVDANGRWRLPAPPSQLGLITPSSLKRDSRIGQFESLTNLIHSPVVGGVRLHALQEQAGNIPLWRDRMPELSIKVVREGRYQRFQLVSRDTTVTPLRGMSITIPVEDEFTLPAGKPFYQFPLFQGVNADELGFSARLDSPAFPLKAAVHCRLHLTFEYGADDPYKLTFHPLDKSFAPVHATWPRTVEEIVIDAPAPDYPPPLSWRDLRKAPKPGSEETSDLLDWALLAVDRLDRDLFIRPRRRTVGTLISEWREDKNGNHYNFVQCDDVDTDIFIHEHHFLQGWAYSDFNIGDEVSFELEKHRGKYSGIRAAGPGHEERSRLRTFDDITNETIVRGIYTRLYVPFIQVWGDGRSITDKECPRDFAEAMKSRIEYLSGLLDEEKLPRPIRERVLFLLACLHRDTSDDCVRVITEQVEDGHIHDPRAIGFALGDASEEWQQYIFNSLASRPNTTAISVFAYAIWREGDLVHRFSISELQAILASLVMILSQASDVSNRLRDTVRALELLLGLLRIRASDNAEIRMLLQPHQRITKDLATEVDRVTDLFAATNISLSTRVQINLHKPEEDRTPDLLYALRLYLTGDDGANAIHISSITDGD